MREGGEEAREKEGEGERGRDLKVTFCLGTEVPSRLSAESILSDTAHTSTGKKTCAQS